jgi:Ras-related protein Rab-8A
MLMQPQRYASTTSRISSSSASTSATMLITDSGTTTTEFSYESERNNLSKPIQVPYHDMYKIVIVGSPSVGKSAIVQRFCYDNFVVEHHPTLGIDLKVRDIELNGQRIKLKLWDTSGEERFRKVVNTYCKGSEAAGVMVVFDVTDLNSFVAAKKWIATLSELASVNLCRAWNPVKILVGNKEDLLIKRVVSRANGEQLAIENKFLYMETSAKSGMNVLESFQSLTSRIKHAKEKELSDRRDQRTDAKYGPNCARRNPNPQSPSKFDKMNNVIKELEREQARALNTFSGESSQHDDANTNTNESDVDGCGCIPISRRRAQGQRSGGCAIL